MNFVNPAMPPILADDPEQIITDAMETVRDHLDMDISYLAELVGDTVHFRRVADPAGLAIMDTKQTRPLSDLYCGHMMAGRLPRLMPAVLDIPLARDLPITGDLAVKSHVSVPIHRSNGEFFGTFCCLSQKANPSLNDRDLKVATMFANLTAKSLNAELDERASNDNLRRNIGIAIARKDFDIHWQPIVSLQNAAVQGHEALSRFTAEPYRPPNLWFADAAKVGLQQELELTAIRKALTEVQHLPPDTYISLNAAPSTIASGALAGILGHFGETERLVLEVTEHDIIANTDSLMSALTQLRDIGVGLAIDDLGAGYAGLSTIVSLRPSILKLDRSLVTDIDTDPARQSLASAMVHFASETKARLIAEGIETEPERNKLTSLGVHYGQGYLFGRPAPVIPS